MIRNLRRSAHAPFWLAGIPAVMISDTANFRNPHYHRPTDTPDTVDPGLVAKAARMVINAIERGAIYRTLQSKPSLKLGRTGPGFRP